jgi:Tol biopolymer transport system component
MLALLLVTPGVFSADQLPAAKAGTIGKPSGQIAFIRNQNIWIMQATGAGQLKITEVLNADGRLSWSPDGTKIAFTRSGRVNLQGPDNLGGNHKVYDIFIAYIDSALNGNTSFWVRITEGVGARDPEWSADGQTLVYYKDMNANYVNAFLPNYQVCTMSPPEYGSEEILRKDWQNMSEFFVSPSMNARGDIAFGHMVKTSQGGFRPRGLAQLNRESFMAPLSKVGEQSQRMSGLVSPAWSPDNQWIACISNSMTNPGVYLLSADFSERYLVYSPPPVTSLLTTAPSFSPDSKWLTFATRDGSIWICDITGNGARRLSGPGLDSAPAWSKN